MSKSTKKRDEESISKGISELSINDKIDKKQKLNPFLGGLSNTSYIKKTKEDDIDVSEIFRNKKNIEIIIKYLNEYRVGIDNKIKGIIIRGNIGCGKMTMIKACINKTEYKSIIYDTDSETEDIFDNLLLTIEAKGFYKLFQNKGTNKRVVIIRDVDGSLKTSQKNDLFKFIDKSKNTIPIIMTSTDRSVSSLREVPKCILQIEFEDPTIAELVRYFSNDKISKSALEKIITDSKFDIRYINNVVNDLENSKIKVNINKVDNLKKDIELDTFNCIKYCADPNKKWDEKLINTSLYTNTTIFHNYPTILNKISGSSDDMDICSKIANNCCESDIIINYAFEKQQWDTLDDSYNILGTIGPLELMNKKNLSYDNIVYPSSNLLVYKEEVVDFNIVEKESIILKILVSKYFKGNKFIGNRDEFDKDILLFRYPIQAYKLSTIGSDQKKVNSFLREFKKLLIVEKE